MPPALSEVAYALEDALIALLQSASAAGSGLQLNASSQYAPVAVVERVAPPEQRLFPSVAAQFRGLTNTPIGQRTEQVSATYDLAVAVQQPYVPGATYTIAEARAKLRPFVDDGAGNGIVELLRANPTLGNLCSRSKILTLDEVTLQSGSSAAGSIVAALLVFQCDYMVRF